MATSIEDVIRQAQQDSNGGVKIHLPNVGGSREQQMPNDMGAFELGGKVRRLRLDYYAMMRLEELTGDTDLGHGGIRRYVDLTTVTFKQQLQFIWALCLADDPSLDTDPPSIGLREVGHWLDIAQMYDLYPRILSAATQDLPEPEETKPAPADDSAAPKATTPRRARTG